MNVFYCHATALYAWVLAARKGHRFSPSRVEHIPKPNEIVRESKEALSELGLPGLPVVHILVSDAESRRNTQRVQCHVWSGKLPHGSVCRVKRGVYIASPEFCFLQMAPTLDFTHLVELGCELCGLYSTGFNERNRGFADLPEPLTTVDKLCSFLVRAKGLYGANIARKAMRFILNRSRSPRESKLAISMALPRRKGGQSCLPIELNYVVPLTGEHRKAAGKGHYKIDAYFPGGMLGFEYYGKDGHTGTVREVKDIRRESILNDKGIAIHVVTKSQAENAQEIIRLAQVVRNARGLRKRTFRLEDVARTQRLLDLLYRSGRQPWWDADIIPLD